MNRLLIVAILVISTSPLYAQRQQQNVAKLKADARNLVGIIGSDRTKTQTYCQIHDLSEQLIQAVQEKDRKKANALAEKIAELYKKMGPEFAAPIDLEKQCRPKFAGRPGNRGNSREPRRILSALIRLSRASIDEMREEHRRYHDPRPVSGPDRIKSNTAPRYGFALDQIE
jgi:hypothetical protein